MPLDSIDHWRTVRPHCRAPRIADPAQSEFASNERVDIMKTKMTTAALAVFAALAVQGASAATVSWADWTSDDSTTVSGSLTVDGSPVSVTYSGAQYAFAQLNGAGTNYWSPTVPYLSSAVSNAPGTPDIVSLSAAGTSVITFSAPVVNPLIALVSWNGANVTFGGGADSQVYDIDYLSSGCGFFGCGSYGSPTSNSFVGVGELHGVIELVGTYSTITFTDSTNEFWHGLTVGAFATSAPVPEPGGIGMMLLGLGVVGALVRRRKGRDAA
jgi:hypothetical protein